MLLTNLRLDRLHAAQVDFIDRGMLPSTRDRVGAKANNNEDEDIGDQRTVGTVSLSKTTQYTCDLFALATKVGQPRLPALVHHFLSQELSRHRALALPPQPDSRVVMSPIHIHSKITVHSSAVATFYAPSDLCGDHGMRREFIRAVESWQNEGSRYDCVFVNSESGLPGMRGLDVVRALLFFSFKHQGRFYPCALVHWYSKLGVGPDEDTRMWAVQPAVDEAGENIISVIHLDTLVRAAHLIGIYGPHFVPRHLTSSKSLDFFSAFYVNKFADHHSFELAF
ncbi:hypothetical protein HGRIS_001222 [Hohenbuehelia grisea]|uniref:Uncharacterized protein n=1 Tax=Hohenbuehelia grisea TaxID=104357 RepID=A0ABR3JNN1_9AGAR